MSTEKVSLGEKEPTALYVAEAQLRACRVQLFQQKFEERWQQRLVGKENSNDQKMELAKVQSGIKTLEALESFYEEIVTEERANAK